MPPERLLSLEEPDPRRVCTWEHVMADVGTPILKFKKRGGESMVWGKHSLPWAGPRGLPRGLQCGL